MTVRIRQHLKKKNKKGYKNNIFKLIHTFFLYNCNDFFFFLYYKLKNFYIKKERMILKYP